MFFIFFDTFIDAADKGEISQVNAGAKGNDAMCKPTKPEPPTLTLFDQGLRISWASMQSNETK